MLDRVCLLWEQLNNYLIEFDVFSYFMIALSYIFIFVCVMCGVLCFTEFNILTIVVFYLTFVCFCRKENNKTTLHSFKLYIVYICYEQYWKWSLQNYFDFLFFYEFKWFKLF